MARRTTRRASSKFTVNLSGYDPEGPDFGSGEGGGFFIPPGEYPVRCESVENKQSKNDADMLVWVFVGTGGKAKGKKFWLYTVLDDHQKVGKTLEALGVAVEDGEVEFDLDEVVDQECNGEVYTDVYNGERRSKLRKVYAGDAESEEEEEKEERRPGRKGNGKNKVVKVSEDEVKDMDEDELEELNEKHDLEVDLSKLKTLSRKSKAVIEALAEKELIE
jgi:hypothetical protein